MDSQTPRSSYLTPQSLARLKGLSFRAQQVVDGLLQGVHRSLHHGSSIEFSEHKEYAPGDELKHLDWRALGRLDKYYVKRFEHETNVRAWCVLDVSASMGYGRADGLTKYDYAAVMVASLGFLLLRQQDAVGVVTFADESVTILPVRAQLAHMKNLCRTLESHRPAGKTELASGLRRISDQVDKRGLVFVFSDFFADHDDAFRFLRQLVGRGHQVTVVHVLDGDEIDFPFTKSCLFEGMESRRQLLVEPTLIRRTYLKRMKAHQDEVRQRCLEGHMAYHLVDTRRPPHEVIAELLTAKNRSRRNRRAGG